MEFIKKSSLLYALCFVISIGHSKDIGFSTYEEMTHPGGNNADIIERIPLYIPGSCPENMILYPDPRNDTAWICDCTVGYLYFPHNNSCHEAYRRGPCKEGDYVILPRNATVPKCEKNPCNEDGLVPYNQTCYRLRTRGGPCYPDVLGVNQTTFELECVSTDGVPFVIIDAPQTPCPVGSRRNNQGLCKKTI